MTKILHVTWLLVASVFAVNLAAESTISSSTNSIPGIEIENVGSIPDDTATQLRSNSAGDLLPYAVVIHNTGSLSVTGLDIRYEISVNGKVRLWNFSYVAPSDLASSASRPIIAPGGGIIITPFHKLNEELMGTIEDQQLHRMGGVSLTAHDIVSLAHSTDILKQATQVTIKVDSVIRSDGTIVGPDRSQVFDQFQREISDYTDFRNGLLQLFAKGATVEEVNAWLQQTASLPLVKQPGQPVDHGVVHLKSTAQRYLQDIQNQGVQYAWDKLKVATPEKEFSLFYKVHQGGVSQ